MNTESIPQIVKKRRANANPIMVGLLAGMFGVFATGPIAYRQRDWKIVTIPTIFSFILVLSVYGDGTTERTYFQKSLQWICSGVAAACLVNKNRDKAKQETSND